MALAAGTSPAAGQEVEPLKTEAELRRQERLFDEHIVRMGQTAYSIARGYSISPVMLAEDNPGVDLERIRPGQVLLIRKKERGRTELTEVKRQWDEMVEGTRNGSPEGALPPAGMAPEQPGQPTPPAPPIESGLSIEPAGSGLSIEPAGAVSVSGRRDGGRNFAGGGTPRIALMLPLSGEGVNPAGNDFVEFYKGALLGLEKLRSQGHSAVVNLWDSGRSAGRVKAIVDGADFADTDLIIGPVYEEEMAPALEFGDYYGVPVVSPLVPAHALDSDMLYQMTPDPATKYEKLMPLLEGDVNIVMISSEGENDADFEREIAAVLRGRNYGRITVGVGGAGAGGSNIASLIDWERPNVFVVLSAGEQNVNTVLSTISSSYSNVSARRGRRADISVIGTSRWAGYGSFVSKNLFFTLGVKFVTNYYTDRSNREASLFMARYLEVYGDLPSRSAFRGYDAVVLFGGALFFGREEEERLTDVHRSLPAEGYLFGQRPLFGGDLSSVEAMGGRGGDVIGDRTGGLGTRPGTPGDGPRLRGGRPASFEERLAGMEPAPLGTSYRFVQLMGRSRRVNNEWTLVSFTNDYNITTR
jgi:hypothetical protein